MRPRAPLFASLLLGSALAAYACDNGTSDHELPTYEAPEASVYVPPSEDAGEDAPFDAVAADVHVGTDGGGAGEGGKEGDAGEGGAPADSASDGSELDAADSGG
jgi:hypothetical protein